MLKTCPGFVRDVNLKVTGPSYSPSVILWREEQIIDLKRLCCPGHPILGVDKTFNVGDYYTLQIHLALQRKDTKQQPLFMGPIYVHESSTFDSFHHYFAHLAAQIQDPSTCNMVVGSDDEKALTKVLRIAFRGIKQTLCTRHLRENTMRHWKDVGVKSSDRDALVKAIFHDESSLIQAKILINTRKEKTIWTLNGPKMTKCTLTRYVIRFSNMSWSSSGGAFWTPQNGQTTMLNRSTIW